ncbi:MAG: hypothetical protein GF331_24140, partial [Chitinivibrionales bacterium]|nr:hypothetical protein [Chitinivibrionales bacterium]
MVDGTTSTYVGSGGTGVRSCPERASSLARLAVAFIAAVLGVLALLLGRIGPTVFALLFGVSAVMATANGLRLLQLRRGALKTRAVPYLLIGLDVAFVVLLAWICGGRATGAPVHLFLLGGLSVAIGMASLCHVPAAPLFGGGLAVIAYAVFQLVRVYGDVVTYGRAAEELLPASALIVLTTILARNVAGRLRTPARENTPDSLRSPSLIERLPEVLFTLDAAGRFVWVSDVAPSVLGMQPSALAGRRLVDTIAVPADFRIAGQGLRGTYRLRPEVRSESVVDCAVWPAPHGREEAWEGFLADVSERERAVAQREEMIARLYQYQKMESLGTLAGGMAHDFRNVLQTVGDVTDEVLRTTDEEPTRERMRRIAACVADARFLLSELLSLGDKDALEFELIEMNGFIGGVVERLSERLGEGYRLTFSGTDASAHVRGDPQHLGRVIENLVSNARDAMSDGGDITLECTVETEDNGAEMVVLRVIDSGEGIPVELAHRIFDPFVTSKGPRKGTGLGLALVQHLVILHKGTVA